VVEAGRVVTSLSSSQYRACAGDQGSTPDVGPWFDDVEEALDYFESVSASNAELDPQYDDTWLETRLVSTPQRVTPERLASMLETYRSDQLK
jgi:hypothetical protein